jgi:GT2 family glycosyltransferase
VVDGAGTVRLVVLNYNGGALTVRCVEHLLAMDWPAEQLQVVVVDNASTDGSIEEIEARFSQVEVRRNDHNGGFPANNLALRDLDGIRYVGLVNNDAFVEPDYLTELVATLDDEPTAGAASAKLLLEPRFVEVSITSPTFVPGLGDTRELGVMVRRVLVAGRDVTADCHFGVGGWGVEQDRDGSFQWTAHEALLRIPVPAGADALECAVVELEAERTKDVLVEGGSGQLVVVVGRRRASFEVPIGGRPVDVVNNVGSVVFSDGAGADRGWLQRDDGQFDDPTDVFAWCGGAVLFRPSYLKDVGLFDEDFFLYYEDTDLSWRGRGRGWRYLTAPTAVARHVHAASSQEGSAVFVHHVERNRLLMLVKDAPRGMALHQTWRYLLVTASYARRDVLGPVLRLRRPRTTTVRRRVRAFGSFLRLLPVMLGRRWRIRRRCTVPDRELVEWLVPRER